MPQLTALTWFLAFSPVVVILYLMLGQRWSGRHAGTAAWLVALAVSYLAFGADLPLLAIGTLKGLWATVFIVLIIWGAIALYNVVEKTGGFTAITEAFTKLTGGNRLLQLLVIGFAFPSFLQGVLGFGTAVAVAAPLLLGLGFSPLTATTVPLIGHSWAVTFGSLGSSYGILINLTGLDPGGVARWSSLFLALSALISGVFVVHIYNGLRGVVEGLPAVLLLAGSMGGSLILVANFVTPYVASVVSGLLGLIIGGIVLPRTSWYRPEGGLSINSPVEATGSSGIPFKVAFYPYFLLLAVVLGVFLTPLKGLLGGVQVGPSFPATATRFGFTNPAVPDFAPISVFITPGVLIFLTVFLSIVIYRLNGLWKPHLTKQASSDVLKRAVPSTMTLVTMSMMASVMKESGMVALLAQGTATLAGGAFPLLAPFIGNLGAFITGSNSSSNILFGVFQRDVAQLLGINAVIIAAMQTTGGALGSMISPLKVAMGATMTGMVGNEGLIMQRVLAYNMGLMLILGLLSWGLITLL